MDDAFREGRIISLNYKVYSTKKESKTFMENFPRYIPFPIQNCFAQFLQTIIIYIKVKRPGKRFQTALIKANFNSNKIFLSD